VVGWLLEYVHYHEETAINKPDNTTSASNEHKHTLHLPDLLHLYKASLNKETEYIVHSNFKGSLVDLTQLSIVISVHLVLKVWNYPAILSMNTIFIYNQFLSKRSVFI